MFRYLPMRERLHTADGLEYETFGIQVVEQTFTGVKIREAVSDVSVDLETVQSIVRLCNAGQLNPVHLLDVVIDFLNA